MTKNWKKITAEKFFFWLKTTIYLSLGLHKELPSYRRSLQLSKENIQHFKTWNFKFFLLLRVIFALLDPDPDPLTRLNPDPILIRIRIRNPDFKIYLGNMYVIKDKVDHLKEKFAKIIQISCHKGQIRIRHNHFRIWPGQKLVDLDPQHCFTVYSNSIKSTE